MIRYWRPSRLVLLYLSDLLPTRLRERLLDWLYPDECSITFLGDP